jgi:hypothetical protein
MVDASVGIFLVGFIERQEMNLMTASSQLTANRRSYLLGSPANLERTDHDENFFGLLVIHLGL